MVLLYKQTTLLDYAAGNAYVSLLHACLLRIAKGNASSVKDKQCLHLKKKKTNMECA